MWDFSSLAHGSVEPAKSECGSEDLSPWFHTVHWCEMRSGKPCEVFSVCSPRSCIVPPEVSEASRSAKEVLVQGNVTYTCDPESVNTILPIQQNPMQNGYDENKGYDESFENKCATNYSIITNNNWNDTHNNMQLTMQNKYTNDDVDFGRLRGAHHALSLHIERTVPHLMMTPHTSWLKF